MDRAVSEDVPVLIVGGSLVGLSAALFLRMHGIDVLAVERHNTHLIAGLVALALLMARVVALVTIATIEGDWHDQIA